MSVNERRSTAKLNEIRRIEKKIQEKWETLKIFEEGAGSPDTDKFMCTFPYPYMNGRLHLGHTFSVSKCEFASGYQRLLGKKCLFPFAFHCTGMPIKAAADKLKREMKDFGFPPNFPQEEQVEQQISPKEMIQPESKVKGKKSKAVAKEGAAKYQWQIMQSLGMQDDEIKQFADPMFWLEYFPPHCMSDLKAIGLKVDWRRAFITTDVNPFYDSFVRWQFYRLKERGKIDFGKRYTIYSAKDGQPCMDHDRSSGEGVGPQDYTAINMKLLEPLPKSLSGKTGDVPIYLIAATLRPETMYGQTNCWVSPDISYIAFYANDRKKIYISTERAARNISYQGLTGEDGKYEVVANVPGMDLMGQALSAPLTSFQKVYALPMLTIKADKGTGIVTSVPSDSPDDYMALQDLKNKQPLRAKFNIEDHMVLPYDPIPIIEIPQLGNLAAVIVCADLKIKSQNDTDLLVLAKEKVYLRGFYEGVMIVDEWKGRKVQDVKTDVRNHLINNNLAFKYMEPERKVISRSGDECIVALCDQWYLNYGEEKWRAETQKALHQCELYHKPTKENFHATLDWLHEHACSRSFGLGTKLPWDPQYLIESLSDSTIYNAYYTVSHLLQGADNFDGKKPGPLNIRPDDLTPEVWDFIFHQTESPPQTNIAIEKLKKMRNEFEFWYPVDLRVSGKDLVQNHLTYYLYNHVAMWPEQQQYWPKGIRANGHLLLNGKKMSKNEGNFLTLTDAVQQFGADGTRIALADAGDSVEDANFVEEMADAFLLRLYTLIEWVKEVVNCSMRNGETRSYQDRIFMSEMNRLVQDTKMNYDKMLFKEALKTGFFEMQSARDRYREFTMNDMNRDLLLYFIELQAIILSPICPHISEHVWELLGKEGSILNARWPNVESVDLDLVKSSEYLEGITHDFRIRLKQYQTPAKVGKGKQPAVAKVASHATIWIAKSFPPWQAFILNFLSSELKSHGELPDNNTISTTLRSETKFNKYMKKMMPFAAMVKENYRRDGESALRTSSEVDEMFVIKQNLHYLRTTLELIHIDVMYTEESSDDKLKAECCPSSPYIVYRSEPNLPIYVSNRQTSAAVFGQEVVVYSGDTAESVIKRLQKQDRLVYKKETVELFRYMDPENGPYKIPKSGDISDLISVESAGVFEVNTETREVMFKSSTDALPVMQNQLVYSAS